MSGTKNSNAIPDYEVIFTEEAQKSGSGLGILKKIFKDNIFKFIVSIFFYLLKHLPVVFTPLITANIINIATLGGEDAIKKMLINIAVLFILLLENIPTHVLYEKYTNKALRTIGAGLRNTLIKKLQHLSVTYHKEIESGRIQSKFLRDIEAIEFLNNHIVKSIFPAIISVIVYLVIAASKSFTVALFFILVVPLKSLLIVLFSKKMKKNNKAFRTETENISAKVTSMIEMIPVTKAHGLENEEIAHLEENIKRLREKGLISDRTNSYFASVAFVVNSMLSAFCLLFTGYLAINGKIPVGDIVLYQSYFNIIAGSITTLINIYPELAKGSESIRSVSEIMLSDDIEDNRGKIKLRYVHGTVRFDNVSYRYPKTDVDVIKNLTLNVEPGDCIAFVGSSGSGKSTVMNLIIGFLKATEGEITIDGKPISMINLSDYRHFISVVPQNSILFKGTIRDNIIYGLGKVDEDKFNKVIEMANITEFINDLPNGINTVIGEHGDKLSGGQKQRISIARALMRDPKILILDEATSALDNISEYHVQKAISSLIKGRTTFIVAHRLSTIRDADKIVVMDNGKCVEFGTYDELMAKKGKFYELKTLNDMNKS